MSDKHSRHGIVVPIKPLNIAKSRLAPVVSFRQRERIALSLAKRVVAVASRTNADVFVVTTDRNVARLAAQHCARVVPDPESALEIGLGSPEALNLALEAGITAAMDSGCVDVLVIPADLPYLEPSDLADAMRRPGPDGVVIAPSLDSEGTNALAIPLPPPIPFSFGPSSFRMHIKRAIEKKLTVRVLRRRGLCCDLDTPAQISEYFGIATSG